MTLFEAIQLALLPQPTNRFLPSSVLGESIAFGQNLGRTINVRPAHNQILDFFGYLGLEEQYVCGPDLTSMLYGITPTNAELLYLIPESAQILLEQSLGSRQVPFSKETLGSKTYYRINKTWANHKISILIVKDPQESGVKLSHTAPIFGRECRHMVTDVFATCLSRSKSTKDATLAEALMRTRYVDANHVQLYSNFLDNQ